jgi:hypothetical protein
MSMNALYYFGVSLVLQPYSLAHGLKLGSYFSGWEPATWEEHQEARGFLTKVTQSDTFPYHSILASAGAAHVSQNIRTLFGE